MKTIGFFRTRLVFLLAFAMVAGAFGPGLTNTTPAFADDAPGAYVTTGRLNVRTGPGVAFAIITRIDQWQTITLLARNPAATWVKIKLPDGTLGWVNAAYIKTASRIVDLPLSSSDSLPAIGATVTVSQLEFRAGPGAQYDVAAVLGRGQAMVLLGRTTDTAWVKVSVAGKGEGWIVARVTVRVAGAESGISSQPFQTSIDLTSLPVLAGPVVAQPSVRLSSNRVNHFAPVYITVQSFPANRPVAAVLTSRLVPIGTVVAKGQTDAAGSAQLFFRMPDMWPSGNAMTEDDLSLAVGTTDGAVLIWSGIHCN